MKYEALPIYLRINAILVIISASSLFALEIPYPRGNHDGFFLQFQYENTSSDDKIAFNSIIARK